MHLLFLQFVTYKRSGPFEAPLERESTPVPFGLVTVAIENYWPEGICDYRIKRNDCYLTDLQENYLLSLVGR